MQKFKLILATVILCLMLFGVGALLGSYIFEDKVSEIAPLFVFVAIVYGVLSFLYRKFKNTDDTRLTPSLLKTKAIYIIGVISVIGLCLGSFTGYENKKMSDAARKNEEIRWNSLTAEQQKAEIAEKEDKRRREGSDSERFSYARETVRRLKANMNDPDSFKIESMDVSRDATTACIKYREKNAFGGLVRRIAIYSNGNRIDGNGIGDDDTTWRAMCLENMVSMQTTFL